MEGLTYLVPKWLLVLLLSGYQAAVTGLTVTPLPKYADD